MPKPSGKTGLAQKLSRLIGWCFGLFWAMLAASALPHPYTRAAQAAAILLALLFLIRLWTAQPSATAGRPLFKRSYYLLAVAAELLGMYAAASFMPHWGLQEQVYSAVGCIVGLHFIGLWLATRSPRFLAITAGMCLVSLLSMLFPFTWHTLGLRYVLLGTGNAAVLWLAASTAD